MKRNREQLNKGFYPAAVALLFFAFAFQLCYHAVRSSATIDEPVHILAGHRHLQCRDFGINPEHPPFLKMLAAAPLVGRSLAEPHWECGSRLTPKADSFHFGNLFVVENGVDEVIVPARLAAALVSLCLALLVFLAAREMFGRWEALTALGILAFEPNLIAHGSVVTTDMVLTATAFASVYALYRYRTNSTWARFLTAGLAVGLMLAAKHSAVVFVPVLLVLLAADILFFETPQDRLRRALGGAAAFAGIFLIGLAVLWAFYGFRYYAIPSASAPSISVADYIRENGRPEMIRSFSAQTTRFINSLRLFPESYVLGMADIVAWGSRNSYVFGKTYATGKWFYFPLAFLVKSSVALLLLLPPGILFFFLNAEKRREMFFMLAPAGLFFAVALTSDMTIGIRHLLPVYGFFTVAAAAGAVRAARKFEFFKYFLILLFVFHLVAAWRTAPNHLAFANDFWGGTDRTHQIFNDSNVETGQSLKLVREYLEREKITDCWFAAFNYPELTRAVQPCRVLPSGLRVLVNQNVIEPVPPVIEGTVLVSVNELPPRGAGEYVPFTRTAPIAFIGGNTLVYRGRFEIPLAAAMSHAYRAGQFLRAGNTDQALAEGRRAVEIGPQDPRTHLSLALALLRAGAREEARRELETVAAIAETDPVFRNAEVRARQELEKLK